MDSETTSEYCIDAAIFFGDELYKSYTDLNKLVEKRIFGDNGYHTVVLSKDDMPKNVLSAFEMMQKCEKKYKDMSVKYGMLSGLKRSEYFDVTFGHDKMNNFKVEIRYDHWA